MFPHNHCSLLKTLLNVAFSWLNHPSLGAEKACSLLSLALGSAPTTGLPCLPRACCFISLLCSFVQPSSDSLYRDAVCPLLLCTLSSRSSDCWLAGALHCEAAVAGPFAAPPLPPPATVPLHPVCVWRASSSCGFACMLCIVWKFGALKRTHCCLCRGHFEKARGSPFARHGRCKFSHCGGENRTAYGGGVPILAQKAQCRHFSESVHRDCKPLSCYLRRAEEKGSCHTHSSSRESTVFRTL